MKRLEPKQRGLAVLAILLVATSLLRWWRLNTGPG